MTTMKTPNDNNKDTQKVNQPNWEQQTNNKHKDANHTKDKPSKEDHTIGNKDNANDDYPTNSTTRTLERRQPSFF